MQQTPAKDSASNVTKQNMQLASDLSGDKTIMKESHTRLSMAVLIFAYVAVCCTHTYIYNSFVH